MKWSALQVYEETGRVDPIPAAPSFAPLPEPYRFTRKLGHAAIRGVFQTAYTTTAVAFWPACPDRGTAWFRERPTGALLRDLVLVYQAEDLSVNAHLIFYFERMVKQRGTPPHPSIALDPAGSNLASFRRWYSKQVWTAPINALGGRYELWHSRSVRLKRMRQTTLNSILAAKRRGNLSLRETAQIIDAGIPQWKPRFDAVAAKVTEFDAEIAKRAGSGEFLWHHMVRRS